MFLNEFAMESIARQYQQDRQAEAKQHRLQTWLHNLRQAGTR
jgi:hypothetical protein